MIKNEEIKVLKEIISECAIAVDAIALPECSLEFKQLLPKEIELVVSQYKNFIDLCNKHKESLPLEISKALDKF